MKQHIFDVNGDFKEFKVDDRVDVDDGNLCLLTHFSMKLAPYSSPAVDGVVLPRFAGLRHSSVQTSSCISIRHVPWQPNTQFNPGKSY